MTAEEIRDALLAWTEEHRRICTVPDCAEPCNLLAFIAHCIGLRASQAHEFTVRLAEYENRCEGCTHLRN